MKKTLFAGILFLLVLGGLFLRNTDLRETSISLKWLNQAQFAGLYVAAEEGYYADEGLSVDFQEFDFNTVPVDALLDGEVDFTLMSTEEFMSKVDSGEDLVALAAFYQISPYALVSLDDVEIDNPADLFGKTLGVKGGKLEEELIYRVLMQEFGINEDDVEFITLGFEQREVDDLMDGSADIVDLYRTDQLYFFDKEGVDYNILYPEKFGVNNNNDLLVTNRALLESDPELVESFVKASVKGWEYAVENVESAVESTLLYVTNENYQDYDYEVYILENSVPLIKPGSGSRIGDIDVEQMADLYEFMRSNDFIVNEFEITDYYTREFIPF